MDVVLLSSYFFITELLSFVCKRVYIYGGRSDHAIALVGRDDPAIRYAMQGGERRLTDSVEVLYVHTTIRVEGGTEGVERIAGGQRGEGSVVFFIPFSTFIRI